MMKHSDANDTYLDEGTNKVDKKTVVIRPGSGKAVGLGVYSKKSPNPEFDITFTPDVKEDIGMTKERLDIPGQARYMLLYQFHNFSEETCRITMHHRHGAAL